LLEAATTIHLPKQVDQAADHLISRHIGKGLSVNWSLEKVVALVLLGPAVIALGKAKADIRCALGYELNRSSTL
jgi:hypothetical protein